MVETWEEKRRRWGYTPTSPVTAPGAVTPDRGKPLEVKFGVWRDDYDPSPAGLYPSPAEAELVTLWKRGPRVVMSITADGQTRDFYMPPARLVYLIREVAEQLADNTLIQ